jgi:penicillin-binding protein-related factor A (putative recombinase)
MKSKKKRKKSTLEQIFQTEILHSVPSAAEYNKISDSGGSQFSVKRPYDWYAIYQDKIFCVENKMHKTNQAWNYNKIADHQIERLLKAYHNGALSYVFLNVRYGLGKKRVCKLFAIHIVPFTKLCNKYKNSDRNSIPLHEFDKFDTFEYERVTNENGDKEIRWMLSEFFNSFAFHRKAINR